MTKRIRHGGKLIHQSFGIIRQHKKLLIFPMMSTLLTVLLFSAIIAPLIRHETIDKLMKLGHLHHVLRFYVVLLLLLSIMHQIIFYFNSALTHCMQQYFKGKKPSLSAGIRMASHRFFQFQLWNAFAGTVGIIFYLFHGLLQKYPFYEKLFQGLGWSAGTYFATPVIVSDKTNPINTIKRSANLMRKTWGTNLRASFGFIVFLLVARVLALIPLITGLFIGGKANILIGFSITVGLTLIIIMINSATSTILCSVLHLFASEGLIAPGFKEDLIRKAFQEVKKYDSTKTQ